jgi:hypothetical protein
MRHGPRYSDLSLANKLAKGEASDLHRLAGGDFVTHGAHAEPLSMKNGQWLVPDMVSLRFLTLCDPVQEGVNRISSHMFRCRKRLQFG